MAGQPASAEGRRWDTASDSSRPTPAVQIPPPTRADLTRQSARKYSRKWAASAARIGNCIHTHRVGYISAAVSLQHGSGPAQREPEQCSSRCGCLTLHVQAVIRCRSGWRVNHRGSWRPSHSSPRPISDRRAIRRDVAGWRALSN